MSIAKSVNQEAINFLEEVKTRAVREEIRRTAAINILIDVFPDITRTECCNAAINVGINQLTARNVWDRRRDERKAG